MMKICHLRSSQVNSTKLNPIQIAHTGLHKSLDPIQISYTGLHKSVGPIRALHNASHNHPMANLTKKTARGCLCFLTQTRNVKHASSSSPTSLYDVLGVSSKATHKEIKSAYYSLSMTYHPDKNLDNADAARKFREVTAAYEILGNFLSRKNYDRGIIGSGSGVRTHDHSRDDAPNPPRHHHHAVQSRVRTQTGHSHIYNFDEWTREHYGAAFAKTRANQKRVNQKAAQNVEDSEERRTELIMVIIAMAVIAATYAMARVDFDTPRPTDKEKDDECAPK